jgi:hypothetical protein
VFTVVVALAVLAVVGITYLHPINRYRRAAMGWIVEHNAIIETCDTLVEEYHGRESAEGFTEAYEQHVLDRWVALQSEAEAYDAPPEVSESHALLLLSIQEQMAAARVLTDGSSSGEYRLHLELALDAMQRYPEVLELEARAW